MTEVSQPGALLGGYVDWLKPVPWQLFCTFTFAWQVSDPQAIRVFREFVDRLEQFLRGPVVFVRGDEKRFSGCGMPATPRHFHVLLTAHQKLDRHLVASIWMGVAGRRENGAGADVRIYDPKQSGLAYVLKFINEPFGDWDCGNLDLFLNSSAHNSKRQRRRHDRHARRLAAAHDQRLAFQETVPPDDREN